MGPRYLSSQMESQQTVEKLWREAFLAIFQHKQTSIFQTNSEHGQTACLRAQLLLGFGLPCPNTDRRNFTIKCYISVGMPQLRNKHSTLWLHDTQCMFYQEITSLVHYLHLTALPHSQQIEGHLQVYTRSPYRHSQNYWQPSFHMQFTVSVWRCTRLERRKKNVAEFIFILHIEDILCQNGVCQIWLQLPIYNRKYPPTHNIGSGISQKPKNDLLREKKVLICWTCIIQRLRHVNVS